ncbi:hypothetical protein [Pseudohaliea rubra]|uniref:hypothetical protein n=1 Tax=Pseudohaliea rubra TaxID=475795 RepID=UPI001185E459|nr:hypothetical protein [Pseudohaliea rubra]
MTSTDDSSAGTDSRNQFLTLQAYDGVRDNNFTLIRLLLARAVLWGHAFPIRTGGAIRDPFIVLVKGSTRAGEAAGAMVFSFMVRCRSACAPAREIAGSKRASKDEPKARTTAVAANP